jgi:hypothetical protein
MVAGVWAQASSESGLQQVQTSSGNHRDRRVTSVAAGVRVRVLSDEVRQSTAIPVCRATLSRR